MAGAQRFWLSPSVTAPLTDVERLQLLREVDRFSHWYSLEDKRVCGTCKRVFSGREIRFQPWVGGFALHCPTQDCPSDFSYWLVWSGREDRETQSPDLASLPLSGEYDFL